MVHAWESHWYALLSALSDDLRIRDETGPAAEGACGIGILMCVRCVNVFTAVEELGERFETAKRLPWVGLLGLLYAAASAGGMCEVLIIYICRYVPVHYMAKSMWTPLLISGFGYFSHTHC